MKCVKLIVVLRLKPINFQGRHARYIIDFQSCCMHYIIMKKKCLVGHIATQVNSLLVENGID